jgi:hypothetical protein
LKTLHAAATPWVLEPSHGLKNEGEVRTITEVLAAFILQVNIPLKAVTLAGEIIALDARLNDYDTGAPSRANFEKWAETCEAYEVLSLRTQTAVAEFARTPEGYAALVQKLSEIKAGLIAQSPPFQEK